MKYDEDHRDPAVMEKAGQILRDGGLVAFPTETVYGLGGDALNPEASAKIYAAKGRPSDNPLIVHIADQEALKVLCSEIPPKAQVLADRFWPGPLTMILPKSDAVPKQTTGGLDTVAVRMPSHPAAYELIRSSGVYIAAPSANTSGRPSPTLASHVMHDLDGKIDMVIDGGHTDIGLESTIVDLTVDIPTILRPGYITKAMLEEAVGEVNIDPAIMTDIEQTDPEAEGLPGEQQDVRGAEGPGIDALQAGLHPKAPGMRYKHYAPKGDLTIVEGRREAVAGKINELLQRRVAEGRRTAVICSAENRGLYHCERKFDIGSREHEESIAANLYDVLRQMDENDVEYIYSESFAGAGLGTAIMNRLLKAAGHKIIRV